MEVVSEDGDDSRRGSHRRAEAGSTAQVRNNRRRRARQFDRSNAVPDREVDATVFGVLVRYRISVRLLPRTRGRLPRVRVYREGARIDVVPDQ